MSRASIRASRPRVGGATVAFAPLESRLLLASLLVTNVNDSGAGSLRQAILDANATAGPSTIGFDIPGAGLHAIAVPDSLPGIVVPVDIDARTQPGYAGSPLVEIDGLDSIGPGGDGLDFDPGSTGGSVEGLAIVRFSGNGIVVQDQAGATIQADDIGYDPSGATPMPGNSDGVFAIYSSNVVIGGPTAADGNVIDSSYNVVGQPLSESAGTAIQLVGTNQVTIQDNIIGTDPKLVADLGNAYDGIYTLGTGTSVVSNTIANSGFRAIDDLGSGVTTSGNVLINNGTHVASLLVTSSTPAPVPEGQAATITYTITNSGPVAATNVQFNVENQERYYETYGDPIDDIPAYGSRPLPLISLVSVTPSQGAPDAPVVAGSQSVGVSLGSLAVGASATVTVVVDAHTAGTDGLVATVSSDQYTLTPSFYPGGTSTSVTITGSPDLSVVALKPVGKAEIGVPYTFQFVVTNHDTAGLAEADYQVTNMLTPSAVLGQVTPSVGRDFGTVGPNVGGPFTYFDGGDLGQLAGASATVSVTVTPTQAGPLAVEFATSSASGFLDVTPADNLAYAGVPVLLAPRVATATLIPASGDIQSIKLVFAAPITSSTATDLRDYRLTTTGTGKSTTIGLRAARYNPRTETVTLTLSRPLSRKGTPLKLVLSGLTGADGTKLPAASKIITLTR